MLSLPCFTFLFSLFSASPSRGRSRETEEEEKIRLHLLYPLNFVFLGFRCSIISRKWPGIEIESSPPSLHPNSNSQPSTISDNSRRFLLLFQVTFSIGSDNATSSLIFSLFPFDLKPKSDLIDGFWMRKFGFQLTWIAFLSRFCFD